MTASVPGLADAVARATVADGVLGEAFTHLAAAHENDAEIHHTARLLAGWCGRRQQALEAWRGGTRCPPPERFRSRRPVVFSDEARGPVRLLRDLEGGWLLAQAAALAWTVLSQLAESLGDRALVDVCVRCAAETARQSAWLLTAIKHAAPQALLVPAAPDEPDMAGHRAAPST